MEDVEYLFQGGNTEMIILGIDPGTAITGYGIINVIGNKFYKVNHGVILTSASMSLPKRLQKIFEEINNVIIENKPEQMAIEQVFFNKNTKTALSVGHARGVIFLSGVLNNLPIAEYTPLQIKQSVVGYGRAEKHQIQKMVATVLGLREIPKPDDAADALAVAICHAQSYKLNSILLGGKL